MDISKAVRIVPGRYVVAVSGGVDSVVLLDILAKKGQRAESAKQSKPSQPLQLTVAHFDHGVRPDSKADRLLVAQLARSYGLPFVYAEGNLGPETSEDKARRARYEFLRRVQKQTGADGIITAHHMDDALETATHNLLRGTGRKGMASLKSVDGIVRPLLHLPKQHLIDYATMHELPWHEDSTNQDMRYRRNYIRHRLLPALKTASPEGYERLKVLIRRQHDLNEAIDRDLQAILHLQPHVTTLRRADVISLPHNVARELVGEWLRRNGQRQFNRKHLERATMAIKTGQPFISVVLAKNYRLELDKHHAHIVLA
jgi:tRNA(Ile)-lysidine synthase